SSNVIFPCMIFPSVVLSQACRVRRKSLRRFLMISLRVAVRESRASLWHLGQVLCQSMPIMRQSLNGIVVPCQSQARQRNVRGCCTIGMQRLPLVVMGGTLRQVRDRLCRCSCVAEISAAYTAAFDMVWPSVKGGSMSFQELKQRHRQEREAQHSNQRLRVHRALSWLDRAEQAEDLDGRFIFLWIAFNAAYATEIDDQQRLSEQETFKAFLQKLCTLDKAKRIDALVWQE